VEQLAVWTLRGDELFFSAGSGREARIVDNPEITGVLSKILTLCSDCSEIVGKSGVAHLLSVVWQLLGKAVNIAGGEREASKPAEICDIVMDYLERNYARRELSVEDISEYTGYSAQYINRKFKENGLGTLRQFIVQMRLHYAAALLDTGNCSVGLVSQLTGWRNQFYFSNVFRKYYGISPGSFAVRKRKENGKETKL
jgi:AraC-like DNA-binding protein